MTKAEFVESLANTLNQTKSESERVLEAVVDVLKQALQRGEKIDLRGLGVFKVLETKPRQARNPRTGEALSIPAKKAAVLLAASGCASGCPPSSPSHPFPHFRIGAQSGKRPAVQVHKSPVVRQR